MWRVAADRVELHSVERRTGMVLRCTVSGGTAG